MTEEILERCFSSFTDDIIKLWELIIGYSPDVIEPVLSELFEGQIPLEIFKHNKYMFRIILIDFLKYYSETMLGNGL